MKVLLLNQCFYPDVVATAQHLTDLAVGLAGEGHEVTVVASDRGYDCPSRRFPRRELWNGIKIIRIFSLGLGKQTRWRRAVNFASFLVSCAVRLLLLPRFDVVLALTSPPLISFLGALFVRMRGGSFFFWVMDLNPDQAIAAGWLKENSVTARLLKKLLHYSLLSAERVVVLDSFMERRIVAKGIPEKRVTVLPPWGHDDAVRFDPEGRESFRRQFNLEKSFVVMYAGNHSPCHPLDTLLEAARLLSDGVSSHKHIVFCFVGGGSEQKRVRDFATDHWLENIICLPYQPFDRLAATLSAADLHAVVMGNEFVGIVHPCKLYNVLSIGSPFLYVGPRESHISEIAAAIAQEPHNRCRAYTAMNGDVDTVVNSILEQAKRKLDGEQHCPPEIANAFSSQKLLPRLIDVLESQAIAETPIVTPTQVASYMSAKR